jgi:L-aminopeptidase/D-esterase-like protein
MIRRILIGPLMCLLLAGTAAGAVGGKPRARDLGVPFTGEPGPLNAITDVAGIEVGQVTLISGSGKLKTGIGPVRTGVTAILPRGKDAPFDPVYAGWFAQNGNGEMTGTTWVEESGFLYGPVMITNTHSVGVVRDAVIAWALARYRLDDEEDRWSEPVVGETWDGWLNDIYGFHVKPEHAFQALDSARPGPMEEGNVGGGTGMICYHFKCGIGTASRRVHDASGDFSVGVLMQANGGSRSQLMVAGVPVGAAITDHPAYVEPGTAPADTDTGSFIGIIATDAPILPHQLKRIARRAGMGLARTGSSASNSSGDIFIAFSTANTGAGALDGLPSLKMLPNDRLTPFFQATAEATEEAIVNALVAAESMTGANDRFVMALPQDRLRALLRKYNRLARKAR